MTTAPSQRSTVAPAPSMGERRPAPGGPPRGGPGGPPRGGPGGRPQRRGRPRYYARRKLCSYCVDRIDYVDYKDVSRLRRFLSDRFKIEARRKSGACAKHQRALSTAIKRARHLAMLPFSADHSAGSMGPVR